MFTSSTSELRVKQVVLKKVLFGWNVKVPDYHFQSMDIETFTDFLSGDMIYQLRASLLGQEKTEVVQTLEVPATFKDAVKEQVRRYIPSWLGKWMPVRYTKHNITTVTTTKVFPCIKSLAKDDYTIFYLKDADSEEILR